MDPALCELLKHREARDTEEAEAIIRLDRPEIDVPGVRIVARFGSIATCRVRVDSILRARRHRNVKSLKLGRAIGPEHGSASASPSRLPMAAGAGDERRPPNLEPTGTGIVLGFADWGGDVDFPSLKHPPSLQHPNGSTRLLALWDQRGGAQPGSPLPYGYGIVHSRRRIDAALHTGDPYGVLGYHPADAEGDDPGTHAAHVMDIAGGNGRAGGPVGVAPGADLVFVHLCDRGTGGLANLGDSGRILEAVQFIARVARAAGRPWVINLSLGRHGGPKDGSTLAELALDHALRAAPGRFIVQSAGNYFNKSAHASGRLAPGQSGTLTLLIHEDDRTPNELEVWYSGEDELSVGIESPTGSRTRWVRLGEQEDVREGDVVVGRLYHRAFDPNNLDNHVDLFLYPWAPAGAWTVTLHGTNVRIGTFHAWLERDEACARCQTRFPAREADRWCTIGTLASGRMPLVVGAYDAHSAGRELARSSSAGPTRDGRLKPELLAPGVEVLAAQSAPADSPRSPGRHVRKSGTSMAAPHVTGAAALCMEAAGRPLFADELRGLLLGSAEQAYGGGTSAMRQGCGFLDIERAVRAASGARSVPWPLRATRLHAERSIMQSTSPGSTAGGFENGHPLDGGLPAWVDDAFIVVARPGQPPQMEPVAGDTLARVALGEPDLGHVAVLADSPLTPWEALDPAQLSYEPEGPGAYATVVDDGARSRPSARRVLDAAGRMPLGHVLLRPRTAQTDAEQSIPPAEPTVSTTFDERALELLPDVLQAKPLARAEAEVPTGRVLGLVHQAAEQGRGGFIDRLLIDVDELPKVVSTVKVHIDLFRTAPIPPAATLAWNAFHAYCGLAYLRDPRGTWGTTVGDPRGSRIGEEDLHLSLDGLFRAAELPRDMTDEQAVNHKLVVCVLYPRELRRVVAPPNHRILDRFDFDKTELKPVHLVALDRLALEIVRHFDGPATIAKITIAGHADEKGARAYNTDLGRRRATAVANHLRQVLDQAAPPYLRGLARSVPFEVVSFGEERPISRRDAARNRRVELTLYRVFAPPRKPVPLNEVVPRLRGLLASEQVPEEQRDRLRCVLERMSGPDVDDRFALEDLVFLINRDNRFPTAALWPRLRFLLANPDFFGPSVSDARAIANLRGWDRGVQEGVAAMNQIINRVEGATLAGAPLGWLALADAFKRFNAWLHQRLRDETSVYYCYRRVFLSAAGPTGARRERVVG